MNRAMICQLEKAQAVARSKAKSLCEGSVD